MRSQAGRSEALLPSGTLTFLFADLEGSTQLLKALGDADYRTSLDAYQAIFRRAIAEHGGHEIGTEGDSFFVVFDRASDAVRCATEVQIGLAERSWIQDRPVRVRIGIHSGDATVRDGNYVGMAVVEASRVMSVANGGQILITMAARELSANAVPTDMTFADVGSHQLKDIDHPVKLFEVLCPGVEKGPPPNTVDARRASLPAQVTPFTGRQVELEEIAKLVTDERVRLITLTGPGGIGKSRLATQIAADVRESFPGGVWFVPLAPLTSGQEVPAAIAQVVGAAESEAISAAAAVLQELHGSCALVVLDNFEHVMDAAAFISQLLGAAPDVTVLVTSREPLRASAERVYPVPQMDVGSVDDPVEALANTDAVALFVDRARARDNSFSLDAGNAGAIAEICRRLDGLPLAIELAAARVSSLGAAGLLDRLRESLAVLGGGPDDAPDRHRTLDAAIAWSFDTLDDREQRVFRALSVFAGGFSPDAAAAVCHATFDDLTAFADRSLIRRDADVDEPRFEMLETIREFAARKLDEAAERTEAMNRHAGYFQQLAATARDQFHGSEAGRWLDRLAADHDNLRTALDRLGGLDRWREVSSMSAALAEYWKIRGHIEEGGQRLEATIERCSDRCAERVDAIVALGRLRRRDLAAPCPKELVPLLDEAAAIANELNDDRLIAWTLTLLAPHSAGKRSDFVVGLAGLSISDLDDRSADVDKKRGKPKSPNTRDVLLRALDHAERAGDHVLAWEINANPWFQKGFKFFRATMGDARVVGGTLDDALARGDNIGAVEILLRGSFGPHSLRVASAEKALAISRDLGDKELQTRSLNRLGELAAKRHDHAAAITYLHEAIEISRATRSPKLELSALGELALVAAQEGDRGGSAAIVARAKQIGGVESWLPRLARPMLWRAAARGLRTTAAGLAWAAAFIVLAGSARGWVLGVAALILGGRLRDIRHRLERRAQIALQHVLVMPFVVIAFGIGLLFQNVVVAGLLLFGLLLVRARMLGRAQAGVALILTASGVLAMILQPRGVVVPALALVLYAFLSAITLISRSHDVVAVTWSLYRVGDIVARAGAGFLAADLVAKWRTAGAFDFAGWGRVGLLAAVGGLVAAFVGVAIADKRLRFAAVLLAGASAMLPYAFDGNSQTQLALGAAFGVGWVLLAALRATETRPRLREMYPDHLRGDPAAIRA